MIIFVDVFSSFFISAESYQHRCNLIGFSFFLFSFYHDNYVTLWTLFCVFDFVSRQSRFFQIIRYPQQRLSLLTADYIILSRVVVLIFSPSRDFTHMSSSHCLDVERSSMLRSARVLVNVCQLDTAVQRRLAQFRNVNDVNGVYNRAWKYGR